MPSRDDRGRQKERDRQGCLRRKARGRRQLQRRPVLARDATPTVAPTRRLSLVARDRLAAKTKEYLDRGFTITGQSETAVNLVKEDGFHLGKLLLQTLFFYPLIYGVRPRDDAYLSVDGNQVHAWVSPRRPGRGIIFPVGLFFGLYCVLALVSIVTASPGAEYRYVLVHAAMLAVGGYGFWIFARAGVRAGSGATPVFVALPEPLPNRRRALDRTPEERLLAFLEEEHVRPAM